MMRLAATDEMAWRCPLGAASRAQPTLAAALRAATLGEHPAEPVRRTAIGLGRGGKCAPRGNHHRIPAMGYNP